MIICLGTYPSTTITASGALCPVCSAHHLCLVKDSETPCFCLVPLWCTYSSSEYAQCGHCAATMSQRFFDPSTITLRAPLHATTGSLKGGSKEEPLLGGGSAAPLHK